MASTSNPGGGSGRRPPRVFGPGDFGFDGDDRTDPAVAPAPPHRNGGDDHGHGGPTPPSTPWYEDEEGMRRWLPWIYGGIVAVFLLIVTPIGWAVGIIALIVLCCVVFGSLVLKGGSGHKEAHAGGHGHGGDEHAAEHGGGTNEDVAVKADDDLGIVLKPPHPHSRLGAVLPLYRLLPDKVVGFYDTFHRTYSPNGESLRRIVEPKLPGGIRIPPGMMVSLPVFAVVVGQIDTSEKEVEGQVTIKIRGGRTVTAPWTLFVCARQDGRGNLTAKDMETLFSKFDGSKVSLVRKVVEAKVDRATRSGVQPRDVDGQLETATAGILTAVNEELGKYALQGTSIKFNSVEDPAEQAAGEIERMQESGTLVPSLIARALGVAEKWVEGRGNPSGGGGGRNRNPRRRPDDNRDPREDED